MRSSSSLSGTAVDALDGDLSGDLQWVSSLDGALGVGPSLFVATLSVGQHEITASVTDSGGNLTTASTNVTVIVPGEVFTALADAFVAEAAPDARFGADTHLIIKGDTSTMQAFLLFQVQPMIGKFILPWFGGGPSVWTTCLLFFQVLLLGGYTYAHLLTRLARRSQVILHIVLVTASILILPMEETMTRAVLFLLLSR